MYILLECSSKLRKYGIYMHQVETNRLRRYDSVIKLAQITEPNIFEKINPPFLRFFLQPFEQENAPFAFTLNIWCFPTLKGF